MAPRCRTPPARRLASEPPLALLRSALLCSALLCSTLPRSLVQPPFSPLPLELPSFRLLELAHFRVCFIPFARALPRPLPLPLPFPSHPFPFLSFPFLPFTRHPRSLPRLSPSAPLPSTKSRLCHYAPDAFAATAAAAALGGLNK